MAEATVSRNQREWIKSVNVSNDVVGVRTAA
jgi:hypothetical protein